MIAPSILVISTVSNVAKVVQRDFVSLNKSLSDVGRVDFVISESDSNDKTLESLKKLQAQSTSLHVLSLGQTKQKFPKRVSRIANARNRALEYVRNGMAWNSYDYVIMADLDGRNSLLKKSSFESIWKDRHDWDVCTANQRMLYYDIWALRHDNWAPSDCWTEYGILVSRGVDKRLAYELAVSSKIIHLPKASQPLSVKSAYGGLAIYKRFLLDDYVYDLQTESDHEICDHVPLNLKLASSGARIIIHPKLINSWGHFVRPGTRANYVDALRP